MIRWLVICAIVALGCSSSSLNDGQNATGGSGGSDAAVGGTGGAAGAAVGGSAGAATGTVLVGSEETLATSDTLSVGEAEAFQMKAAASGTVHDLHVYLDTLSTCTRVIVGVYSENANQPDDLLARGTIMAPLVGWNDIPAEMPGVIMEGYPYWIALLCPQGETGTLKFRISNGGMFAASVNAATSLDDVPQKWSPGLGSPGASPMSAYVTN